VSVPVIASGGVGTLAHLADGVLLGRADAVLAASIFSLRRIYGAAGKAVHGLARHRHESQLNADELNEMNELAWLDEVRFDGPGLVPIIAQDASSNRVLMVANGNRDALIETARTGGAVYLVALARRTLAQGRGVRPSPARARDSPGLRRRRGALSGRANRRHRLPHGARKLLLRLLENDAWRVVDPVLKDPELIYGPVSQ